MIRLDTVIVLEEEIVARLKYIDTALNNLKILQTVIDNINKNSHDRNKFNEYLNYLSPKSYEYDKVEKEEINHKTGENEQMDKCKLLFFQIQEKINGLHANLFEKVVYLFVCIMNCIKTHLKTIEESKKKYEKFRIEFYGSLERLQKARQSLEQKNFDILNLVQAERNHAITWENYENSILDLLNVLMGEDENYQCGKFIIQIIELHKRFFERAQKAIRENNNKQEISSLQKKAAKTENEFFEKEDRLLRKKYWDCFLELLLNIDNYSIHVILDSLSTIRDEQAKTEIFSAIAHLFILHGKPVPKAIPKMFISKDALASGEHSEEIAFEDSEDAQKIFRFVTDNLDSLMQNLNSWKKSECLTFCSLVAGLSVWDASDSIQES